MELTHKLRLNTQDAHSQIEEIPLLKKITTNAITYAEYQLLIAKFYGFIAPCEAVISCQELIADRKKSTLLAQDLVALGINQTHIACCEQLPPLGEREQILGYMYVLEGSTLGGQIITQYLNAHLKLSVDSGGGFFYGYGKRTKEMWQTFCQTLNNVNDPQKQEIVIRHARLTFQLLHQWMLHY